MSEKKYKQTGVNGALIATIIVSVAAIAAIIALVVIITSDNGSAPGGSTVEKFTATQEQVDECLISAHDLVASNYEVIKLYITQGLPHLDEPYGNLPGDGIYTVDSEKYKTPGDMQSLLKSIYTEQAADEIWARGVFKTRYMKDGLAVESDGEGVEKILGISADFSPDESYSVDWSSSPLEVIPTAEDRCKIIIYVNGSTPADSEVSTDNVLSTVMVKENGSWRLTELVS